MNRSVSTTPCESPLLSFGGHEFQIQRPHRFGLVIEGLKDRSPTEQGEDYLHQILLNRENFTAFMELIRAEGLVVCKNVRSDEPSYRRVRGKSSGGKLSQAEYYHHDGCSCPIKPAVVEIRLPYQVVERQVATAIAPFRDVIRAMLLALPEHLQQDDDVREAVDHVHDSDTLPKIECWDRLQGRITRLVRRDMDAESCRQYFRSVDKIAGAYAFAWQMGESRFMVNNHEDLRHTMQHRRAYQRSRQQNEQNGSLVKRWTAEEYQPNAER